MYDPQRSLMVAEALTHLARAQRRMHQPQDAERSITDARRIHSQHVWVGQHHRGLLAALSNSP